MTRTFLFTAAFVSAVTILASPASACSCVGICDKPPACDGLDDAMKFSDVVFLGKVTTVARGPRDLKLFTFAVDRVWKGPRRSFTDVQTYPDDGMCGFPFKKGGDYLVFAVEREGALFTSTCSLTSALKKAGTCVQRLDKRRAPK